MEEWHKDIKTLICTLFLKQKEGKPLWITLLIMYA